MQQILVIPASNLGLLEPMFKEFAILELKSKRDRILHFNRIVEVLKALRLVAKTSTVQGLGYGAGKQGELSAFVVFEAEQVMGQTAPKIMELSQNPNFKLGDRT